MGVAGGPNILGDENLVFIYDTGDSNSYKGIPVVNCAKNLSNGTNLTVTEITDGSILPPVAGMRVYKFVSTNTPTLYRQGGYYSGGGFAGSNANPLILGRTSPSNFTTVGTGKYRFGMYVRGDSANSSSAAVYIDIGDRNAASATLGSSSLWQLIQTNDSAGINSTTYPYDFFDLAGTHPITFYVAGYGIWRSEGTVDNLPPLDAYPQGNQYVPFEQARSVSASLFDISPYANTINVASMSFDSNAQLVFDGTNDFIYLPSSLTYTTSVSAFAWCKTNGIPSGGYHIVFGPTSLEISIPTSGQLRTGIDASTRYVSNHGSGLTDGNWHYIGFTFEDTTKTSYIDGVSVGTQTTSGSLVSNVPYRSMGRFGTSTVYYMNGNISTAQIYSRALTPEEVLQNYNAQKSRFNR